MAAFSDDAAAHLILHLVQVFTASALAPALDSDDEETFALAVLQALQLLQVLMVVL